MQYLHYFLPGKGCQAPCQNTFFVFFVIFNFFKVLDSFQNIKQGSINLVFACTDFCARKMVLHACCVHEKLCVHKKVTVVANLHRLIYSVVIDIVFPLCFGISQL